MKWLCPSFLSPRLVLLLLLPPIEQAFGNNMSQESQGKQG